MAQQGDTITYTFAGSREQEDVSNIDEVKIEYIDGAGGKSYNGFDGGFGGRVENVVADVSDFDTLYIWVSSVRWGRYDGAGEGGAGNGAGTSELSVVATDADDSDTEPFIAAVGGGGGGSDGGISGGAGARGVDEFTPEGIEPPKGGEGGMASDGGSGEGAISGHKSDVPIIDSGSTIVGGGNGSDVDGEIQITYKSVTLSAPSNVQITDDQTEDELTIDWDEVSGAAGYYVYRSESSFSDVANATQVADVSSPPFTDTGLEDGEQYYYRVTSHD